MSTSQRAFGRTAWVAVRAMALFTVVLGLGYTFAVTGAGQLLFPHQSNGSMLTDGEGAAVGSSLVGQSFADSAGVPLAQYFQGRPSAAGDGYDGAQSGASNLGPENPELIQAVAQRRSEIARLNGVSEAAVPADAVTASSSGLDPHVSTAYADIQIARVAAARGLSVAEVRDVVEAHTEAPDLGYLGESRVNVLALNLALNELKG